MPLRHLLSPLARGQLAVAKLARARSQQVAWRPNAGRQQQAYECEADELFYGGQAGGGKTDLLIGLAGTAHVTSVIFRREFPRLRAVIERSRAIYNADGDDAGKDSYNESLHIWRLQSGTTKRSIEFGSMQYEKDKEGQRGRPRDFYGFDEITEFTENQYRFVTAWNRTTIPGQRCRIVAAGNPPTTAEGEWVIRYWAPWLDSTHPNPAKPGEIRWFARIDDKDVEVPDSSPFQHNGETLKPRSRSFIPAGLDDNPYLRETDYRAILQSLPEPLRSQMLHGSFTASVSDHPWQLIPTAWIRAAMKRERPATMAAQNAIGIDVARGGADKSVFASVRGFVFDDLVKLPGVATLDSNVIVQQVFNMRSGKPRIGVDVIGVGAAAYDSLRATAFAPDVLSVHFGMGTDATDGSGQLKFRNVRAESYWKLREALDPTKGAGLCLPDDLELLGELAAPRWSVSGGRITIEEKDRIKDRIGRSPDSADAVAIAWYAAQYVAPPEEQTYTAAPSIARSPY